MFETLVSSGVDWLRVVAAFTLADACVVLSGTRPDKFLLFPVLVVRPTLVAMWGVGLGRVADSVSVLLGMCLSRSELVAEMGAGWVTVPGSVSVPGALVTVVVV